MITETTLLNINNSQDISESGKRATRLYLESCSIVNGDTSAENSWSIENSIVKEQLNTELKRYFELQLDDIENLRPSVLSARTTPGISRKPVFAKAIANRFLERTITTTNEGFYESRGIDLSEKLNKSISTISRILDANINIETVRSRISRMFQILTNSTTTLNFTNIDLDTIESLLIGVFSSNHSQAFILFVDQISHIENLSSVIFSSITLKICAKLSPLLAAKFLMHYKTNERMLGFLRGISNKITFKNSFIGQSSLFLAQHRRKITYGFLGGVTIGSMIGYQYHGSGAVQKKEIIIPIVRHFVDNMYVISENAKLITYTCSKHSAELINAFYRGFRETLIQSGLELLQQVKNVVTSEAVTSKKRLK